MLTAAYAGGAVTFTVAAATLRMYSTRTRPVMDVPSAFFATGKVIRMPALTSPSHPHRLAGGVECGWHVHHRAGPRGDRRTIRILRHRQGDSDARADVAFPSAPDQRVALALEETVSPC